MREGYGLEQRGEWNLETLIAPNGERIAWVRHETGGAATTMSMIAAIEPRHVSNGAEEREASADMAEEHYRLTTPRHRRFPDPLNKWVDYPVVKLIGTVAAAASVRAV